MDIQSALLPHSWDCHTHVLDPTRFPYREDRKYTPAPAVLPDLIANSSAQNTVFVQATPEKDEEGLLHHLEEASRSYPYRTFRGTIVADTAPKRDVRFFDTRRVDQLHSVGVRSIRLQGIYSSLGSQTCTVQEYLVAAAASHPVAQLDWSISMQQPLNVWAGLSDFLINDPRLKNVTIIADHNGSARPDDLDGKAFKAFLDLLRTRRNTYVKIGALHRRAPRDFTQMESIVKALASAAPRQMLWGSDWPHVDTATYPALETAPHIEGVDGAAELEAVKGWLSEDQFRAMMVETPTLLYS